MKKLLLTTALTTTFMVAQAYAADNSIHTVAEFPQSLKIEVTLISKNPQIRSSKLSMLAASGETVGGEIMRDYSYVNNVSEGTYNRENIKFGSIYSFTPTLQNGKVDFNYRLKIGEVNAISVKGQPDFFNSEIQGKTALELNKNTVLNDNNDYTISVDIVSE